MSLNVSPDEVRKIAVLRPNAVGDFVFALPALHALKQRYPDADIVLLGKDWHAGFLRDRPGPVDRVAVMPPVPGVGAPVCAICDEREIDRFVDAMRAERFDIALQMFGAGHYSNPFLLRLGARLTAGARADGAPALERWVPYCEPNNRRLALLEIASLVGAWPGPQLPLSPLLALPPLPELTVTDADRIEAIAAAPPLPSTASLSFSASNTSNASNTFNASNTSNTSNTSNASIASTASGTGERLAVLQPGATDPRRCWPAERFAALGDRLAQAGMRVAVNGTAGEAARVDAVAGAMRHPAIGLAGVLSLGGLCGLLERAALVVSNDTGPLHLALALGRPSVGIFWLTNLIEGMPLRQSHLRAALSLQTHCPVCGQDNISTRCPHDESFVADVSLEQLAQLALSLSHQ